MVDKNSILKYLEENDIEEVEELKVKEDLVVLRFFYDFDEDEIKAAKAYAKDECSEEELSDEWYEEYYLPYLTDLAVDNIGETVEGVCEEYNLDGQFASYDIEKENDDYCECIAIFFDKGSNYELEELVEELDL